MSTKYSTGIYGFEKCISIGVGGDHQIKVLTKTDLILDDSASRTRF